MYTGWAMTNTFWACFYSWQSRFERATRSLATFVRSHRSLAPQRSAALRSAPLASLARSVHGLAHSLRSLPCGTVEIHKSVFTLRSRSKETNAIVVVTPIVLKRVGPADSFANRHNSSVDSFINRSPTVNVFWYIKNHQLSADTA